MPNLAWGWGFRLNKLQTIFHNGKLNNLYETLRSLIFKHTWCSVCVCHTSPEVNFQELCRVPSPPAPPQRKWIETTWRQEDCCHPQILNSLLWACHCEHISMLTLAFKQNWFSQILTLCHVKNFTYKRCIIGFAKLLCKYSMDINKLTKLWFRRKIWHQRSALDTFWYLVLSVYMYSSTNSRLCPYSQFLLLLT